MIFLVKKASDWDFTDLVEINTLKELLAFKEKCGNDIMIINNWEHNNSKTKANKYKYTIMKL